MDRGRGVKRKLPNEPHILSEAPREISIVQYAQSRAAEIKALSQHVNKKNASSYINTFMPRHMRRRAMSHNIKRFPRRIRNLVNIEAKETKRPSRKYRRRPKNLLAEYNRRQRKNVWLETHIWHAKRFIMVNKWGYRIPLHPTQKGTRAAYRASQRSCLVMDVSYMCCIEISGPQENILQGLDSLTSSGTGSTFRAKSFIGGLREGKLILYHRDTYPYDAIGCVTFLWKPTSHCHGDTDHRVLWLWCHPSCYTEVWDAVRSSYLATESSYSATEKVVVQEVIEDLVMDKDCVTLTLVEENKGSQRKGEVNLTLAEENKASQRKGEEMTDKTLPASAKPDSDGVTAKESDQSCVPEVTNTIPRVVTCVIGHVTVKSLKDKLVRHRLIGPKAQDILARIIRPSDVKCVNASKPQHMAHDCTNIQLSSDTTKLAEGDVASHWWTSYYADADKLSDYSTQRQFIEERVYSCSSPGEAPPSCVIGMVVRDPRLLRPAVKMAVHQDYDNLDQDSIITNDQLTSEIASSPIWDNGVRESVKTTKMTDFKMNELRSKQLVPGSPLDLGNDESRIPILLIQNPGFLSPGSKQNYGSGWDIIIPAGWSMAFWVGFIYSGAHPIGLRESQSLAHEQQCLHFPDDYPDTNSGKCENKEVEDSLKTRHDKRPPAKNPNYVKLGRLHPFRCPWEELLSEWKEASSQLNQGDFKSEKFFVLRNKADLRFLEGCFICSRNRKGSKSAKQLKTVKESNDCFEEMNRKLADLSEGNGMALVAVTVNVISKGTPDAMATISMPTEEDIDGFCKNRTYGGPVEPLHADLEKLAKKEQKRRAKKLKVKSSKVQISCEGKEAPANKTKILKSCSRPVIGYLHHGGFSLSGGVGTGLGFCALTGLAQLHSLLKGRSNVVLLRNPKSFQYRFAYIQIMCS